MSQKNKAYVDLETKKIHNCKKNSFEYFHERGHLLFHKKHPFLEQNILTYWIVFTSMGLFFKSCAYVSVFLMGCYVVSNFYEERYADKYAIKKLKESKS